MKKIDLNDMAFYRGACEPMRRMNKDLQNFYRDKDRWNVRAECASSVMIVFSTNADTLQWQCTFGEAAREVFTTDIFVDGKRTTLEGAGPHKLALPGGTKVIEIAPPHLVVLADYSLEVNDEATVEPITEKRKKLLICGDSILQGMTCSSPARASVVLTARALDVNLHNTSVGGVIMLTEIVEASLKIGGDAVVVGLGINDIAQQTPLDVFRERTRKVLEMLHDFPGKSFIITPIPSTREDLENKRGTICQIIREEQQNFRSVTLVEGESFFPCDDSLLCDQLHPNDKGMEVYARGLIDMLKTAL